MKKNNTITSEKCSFFNILKKKDIFHFVNRKYVIIFAVLIGIVISFYFNVVTGSANIGFSEIFSSISNYGETLNSVVMWTYRLPISVFAILIGSSLGLAGACMQTILNNSLASPYTLGVSASASFGAALFITFGGSFLTLIPYSVGLPLSAFIFTLLCSLLIVGLAQIKHDTNSIIFGGISLLFLFNSATAFVQYISSQEELQSIVFWMFGSLINATWIKIYIILFVFIVSFLFVIKNSWKLTTLRVDDAQALSLGINVKQLRLSIMMIVSMLTAVSVCFSGSIGFIGLVAPHISRILVGDDQRFYIILSTLFGGLLLSISSIISKIIITGAVFPVGIITTFLGVPFFLFIVISDKRNK